MAAKGFYAYEVFSSIVGLVVPVLFMALVFTPVLLVFMFLGWGGILALLDRLLTDATAQGAQSPEPSTPPQPLKDLAVLVAFNVLMLGGFFYGLYTTEAEGAARPLLAIIFGSLALGLVLVVAQHVPPTGRAAAYGLLLLAALLGPMFGAEPTTRLVETILSQFRLGGVMVTIVSNETGQDANPASALYGRLIFLSSSNLYLEAGCPRKLMIVPRRDSFRLEFAEIRTAGLKEFRCEGITPSQGDNRR